MKFLQQLGFDLAHLLRRHDYRFYDGLEIGGIAKGDGWEERVDDDDAQYWCVFGHMTTGGCNEIRDFTQREKAEAFADRLLKQHPQLLRFGIC